MVLGYLLEWLREHKHRRCARQKSREAAQLGREVERLRSQTGKPEDDVLALLGKLSEPPMRVKICGLRSRADAAAAAVERRLLRRAGVLPALAAPPHARRCALGGARACPTGLFRVALTVDAEDDDARGDPRERADRHAATARPRNARSGSPSCAQRFRLPVMKAVGVADEGDLAVLDEYARGRRPAPGGRAAAARRGRCPAATASPSTGG